MRREDCLWKKNFSFILKKPATHPVAGKEFVTMKNANTAAVLGALVADSAALGLHWLYNQARIAEIEELKGLAFLQREAVNYAGKQGYLAHGRKAPGESTGYGEVCLLMLKHLAKHGNFNRIEHQTEYRAHCGPGGEFVGYIDSPTRMTLRKLLFLEPAEFPAESGADDDQHPALAALPALVATHGETLEDLMKRAEEVVRVTSNNELAVAAARCSSAALFSLLQGIPMTQALTDSLPFAGTAL